MRAVVKSVVTCPYSSRVKCASTLKYHDTDKHDTPPGHSLMTPGQPALLIPLKWWTL